MVSLILGFFAVQLLAERLVMETTRQSARDYAIAIVGLNHVDLDNSGKAGALKGTSNPAQVPREPSSANGEDTDVMKWVRSSFLNPRFNYEILRIHDGLEHNLLNDPIASPEELPKLVKLNLRLAEMDSIVQGGATVPPRSASGIPEPSPRVEAMPSGPPDASTSSPPVVGKPLPSLTNPGDRIFEESGPIDGFYYYYHPIRFEATCLHCHMRLKSSIDTPMSPSIDPFRVVRVRMPYSETRMYRIWSYSILTSIGIATLALSLLFIHWVLKRLVISPLSELKLVSEEITKGKTNLQFRVDTDDDFSELSDSFNRMLRHLTETQFELQTVNDELDNRIDELASVNLQLFEANRLKGEFLANMSHELRTPLNSILGFSDVLAGIETLTDKQRRWVSNIQNSGRILLEMINDILDLAKVEAGKMEVRPADFSLLTVIGAQVEIFRKMAEDKNIDIQVDSNQSEMRVFQDQSKLAQILTNLLSNAIKFTPEGGLVTIACDWIDESEFFVSVSDTGVGIAPHEHEIIFEKFRQAATGIGKDSLTREHTGTGLGLSIVRELCRLLGGDISLSSQLGQGSTFRVLLPKRYESVASGDLERIAGS